MRTGTERTKGSRFAEDIYFDGGSRYRRCRRGVSIEKWPRCRRRENRGKRRDVESLLKGAARRCRRRRYSRNEGRPESVEHLRIFGSVVTYAGNLFACTEVDCTFQTIRFWYSYLETDSFARTRPLALFPFDGSLTFNCLFVLATRTHKVTSPEEGRFQRYQCSSSRDDLHVTNVPGKRVLRLSGLSRFNFAHYWVFG